MEIARPAASRPIGTILMDAGTLSPEGAERILKLQREAKLQFGDAGLQLGLLSEQDIQFALAKQFDYAYLSLAGDKPLSEELIAAYRPFSPAVEHLRALRSQLMLRWFDKAAGRRALAIVGPGRSEGRSFLAANLAIVFAQLGERTLLIDADLRAARQHKIFRLDNRVGLSSLLGGRANGESIVPVAALANLAVLPAGPTPPNPLELLNRPNFDTLLQRIAADYDIVLVDTPAAVSGADAGMIAIRVGAALALARRDATPLAAFNGLTHGLAEAGVAVVGSVFNDPPPTAGGLRT